PAVALPLVEVPDIRHPDGESASWWFRDGAAQAAARGAMEGRARNVILFVGDGMSLATVAAARIHQGQLRGAPGEENRLSWEHFPATALSKTYNTDQQTPDSAGTMSAMATGAKTRAGMISVAQSMHFGDCSGLEEGRLLTLWELAAEAGMATGVVTTTRLTHATPASTLAHSPSRNWENDTQVPEQARAAGCTDIARQMIENPYGTGPRVMLAGGRAHLMTTAQADPEYPGRRPCPSRRRAGRPRSGAASEPTDWTWWGGGSNALRRARTSGPQGRLPAHRPMHRYWACSSPGTCSTSMTERTTARASQAWRK